MKSFDKFSMFQYLFFFFGQYDIQDGQKPKSSSSKIVKVAVYEMDGFFSFSLLLFNLYKC